MKTIDADLLAEIRGYNALHYEDDDVVALSAPCPTYTHRGQLVPPQYVVRFRCPHGESSHVFCTPCTADRRAGVFACVGQPRRSAPGECPGARAYAVETFVPKAYRKPR